MIKFLNYLTAPLAFAAMAFVYGTIAQYYGFTHKITILLMCSIAGSFAIRRVIDLIKK